MLFCGWTLTPGHAVEARDKSQAGNIQVRDCRGYSQVDMVTLASDGRQDLTVHKLQCVARKESSRKERLAGYTFTCGYRLLFYHSVVKSCLTICDPMDCGPPNFSAHEISWARILEWVAISFFRGSSPPRNRTCVSCVGRQILYTLLPGKPAADYFHLLYRGSSQYILPPKAYRLKSKKKISVSVQVI